MEDTGSRSTTFTDNTAESLTFYGYYVSALRGEIEGQAGRSVLFIPAYRLVQDMLAAKRDLDLPRMLRKLDNSICWS